MDGIWALHARATLLWTACALHLHIPASGSPAVATDHMTLSLPQPQAQAARAGFALGAWKEAQTIGHALVRHVCKPGQNIVFQTREYLFNAQKLVARAFAQ
jgi:hypothetical protein